MDRSTNFPSITLHTTSFQDQIRRQRISEEWQVTGIERYKQTAADLASMPVVGDMGSPGYNPDRFRTNGG